MEGVVRDKTKALRSLGEAMIGCAELCVGHADLKRLARPRRTRLKGNPMSQSNAVVSSVPVQVRREG